MYVLYVLALVTCAEPKAADPTKAKMTRYSKDDTSANDSPTPSVTPNNRQDGKLPALLACMRRVLEEFPRGPCSNCSLYRHHTTPTASSSNRSTRALSDVDLMRMTSRPPCVAV